MVRVRVRRASKYLISQNVQTPHPSRHYMHFRLSAIALCPHKLSKGVPIYVPIEILLSGTLHGKFARCGLGRSGPMWFLCPCGAPHYRSNVQPYSSVPSKTVWPKIGKTGFARMRTNCHGTFSWQLSQFLAKANDFGPITLLILPNLIKLAQAQKP